MSNDKDKPVLSEPRSAFLEGADRLDQVQRAVRVQHMEETGAMAEPRRRMSAVSPDEAWSRKYMTQAIGPISEPAGQAFTEFARSASAPNDVAGNFAPAEIVPKPELASIRPMATQLGRRQTKQRGWLGRLLLGSRA